MPYPSHDDYLEAIRTPRACFKDALLRAGVVESGEDGCPIGAGGTFAVVFRLTCGAESYAVKCFTREVAERAARYEELSAYLRAHPAPCFTTFEYIRQGILVNGDWYPIVRMPWVEAPRLDAYLDECLRREAGLSPLLEEIIQLERLLRRHHIGHGDLQHGNLLVEADSGRIVLVDYDGMYVPPLAGRLPEEDGHPNYQHPQRIQQGHYAEEVDRFSLLTLYLSVRALESDPSLWLEFHGADNLLFTSHDFLLPGATRLWERLQDSPGPNVRALARDLIHCCRGPLDAVPTLTELLGGMRQGTKAAPARDRRNVTRALLKRSPAWLVDALAINPADYFAGEWNARRYLFFFGVLFLITGIIATGVMVLLYTVWGQ